MNLYTDLSFDENRFQLYLYTNYLHFCAFGAVVGLSVIYYVYSKAIKSWSEKTTIPKLYKKTITHSLWMGILHSLVCFLCFSQLNALVYPLIPVNAIQPFVLSQILYAATAKFCHNCDDNDVFQSNNSSQVPVDPGGDNPTWTVCNAVTIIIILAVLLQETLLAARNKMHCEFFSRLFAFIFVNAAVRTRCPILSIQGMYMMSANIASKEISRASVAWQSYSQEDSDLRPSLLMKSVAFVLFLIHMTIWFAFMLFYMPYFLHKLPPVCEDTSDRLFLAYTYLALLAYVVLEVASSPLWTTLRCMACCRQSAGIFWRVLAVSDCHLLGHYSSLVLDLHRIQVVLDKRKALFRNKMVQKHLEERMQRKPVTPERPERSTNLLTAVKTVVALKKKIQRHQTKAKNVLHSPSVEHLPQATMKADDSNVEAELEYEEVETVKLFESDAPIDAELNESDKYPGTSDSNQDSKSSQDDTVDKSTEDQATDKGNSTDSGSNYDDTEDSSSSDTSEDEDDVGDNQDQQSTTKL